MSNAPKPPESSTSSTESSAVLEFDRAKALKIALGLRRCEYLFQILNEDQTFVDGPHYEEVEKRRVQLIWLAGKLEAAAKAVQPDLPKHERPRERNRKQVWCRGDGCTNALTLDQARQGIELCNVCRAA